MRDNYINKLKEQGIKVTPKRKAIIEFFEKENRCLTPEAVWLGLKNQFERCGLPSIYRNLKTFAQSGILFELQKSDRRLYYALNRQASNSEHYIICKKCGKFAELPSHSVVNVAEVNGFKVLNCSVHAEGLCAECQEQLVTQ